ncbi:MAG: hypothetical protein GX535_17180 [Xanthomonadaceae bacterium]|nr:hypothetical protein [Xanthomonadaceae bacterium]
MHLRTEELLSIRDGVFDAKWRAHLERCAECSAHLEALERTRRRLRELPMIEPAVSWSDVLRSGAARSASQAASPRRTRALIGVATAASVAMVALVIGTRLDDTTGPDAPEALATTASERDASTTVDLATLIERSRRLDALLQTMPARPHVERVSMAATLDTMEERVQWLDYQLAYAGDELDPSQSQRLWQERVELMDSLVKVRYAQARTAF